MNVLHMYKIISGPNRAREKEDLKLGNCTCMYSVQLLDNYVTYICSWFGVVGSDRTAAGWIASFIHREHDS